MESPRSRAPSSSPDGVRASRVRPGAAGGARRRFLATLGASLLATRARAEDEPVRDEPVRIVYVSSYHRGYAWSDGVERGLRQAMRGHDVYLHQIDMDTKRESDDRHARAAARDALAAILRHDPDVVITSDDNAARYLIVPHLLDRPYPVVFCGVNWTVEEYGFPAPNVTGMVEIAPISPMIDAALAVLPTIGQATYIGGQRLSEVKNFEHIRTAFSARGIELEALFAPDFETWKSIFVKAQASDVVVVGSYSGIDGWDWQEASWHARTQGRRLSLTSHDWMMPVAMLGFTKLPEEHGAYALKAALAIAGGTPVDRLPLVTNVRWDTWVNPLLPGPDLPDVLVSAAKLQGV